MKLSRLFTPALALMLVAPALGEVLSGSSPPLELLNLTALIFTIGLYGSGALLVREIAFRWGKGWPSILVLGAAYGIIEEGLMCKSFFDPGWMDVGLLGSYGRWLGVNWVWTVELIIFHAVFSISIAILLVNLAYPSARDKRWAGNKTMIALGIVLSLVVVLGYFAISPYRPNILLSVAAALAAALLILVARLLPTGLPPTSSRKVPRPRWLILAGFAGTLLLFFLVWVLPGTGINPLIPLLLLLALAMAGLLTLSRLYGRGSEFTALHKLALATGAICFFLLLSAILEMSGVRGMGIAGAIAAILLLLLWREVKAASTAPGYG